MNKLNIKTPIGISKVEYNEAGIVTKACFEPSVFDLPIAEVEKLLAGHPSGNPNEAVHNAEMVVSQWFLHLDLIETEDRDSVKIESETLRCDMWASGVPKHCEVAFYLTPRARQLTGVR